MELTGALGEAGWEAHRPAVFGAAYRILGAVAEAEDVTQEVWLRAAAADLSGVRDLRAWLVTLAVRTSYNVLKSARVRRESYVGPWLPEPLLTGPDAAVRVLMDESVSTAMLVVMETLSPAERVALVLHDVFGFPFDRIAEVLGGTPAAGRKLASRARVTAVRERPRASRAESVGTIPARRHPDPHDDGRSFPREPPGRASAGPSMPPDRPLRRGAVGSVRVRRGEYTSRT
ncbi:sigma-70 family RNA polymerase sigma factor [Nonomuraea sp. B12E4]|uniref:sigma-70 family RNA polymerase sigma factor n=1 Tax=Nonomuraea sp. B12E4 TaxID=3153564 RepID=UPI00325D5255